MAGSSTATDTMIGPAVAPQRLPDRALRRSGDGVRDRRIGGAAFALGLGIGLSAVAGAAEVETRLYLIGDAGAPSLRGEPVLAALRSELARDPGRSFVVFLGDNVYPRGLPDASHPGRPESERRLREQVEAVRDSGARFLFVPGNHDWDRGGPDGLEAVRRQARHVLASGGPRARFEPRGGCPGPVGVPVGERLLLIALDTQWWLHAGDKPVAAQDGCDAYTEAGVVQALGERLRAAGERRAVVVAHHPLLSGGAHGGHFGWKEHVFPLREWKGWLWLPLPLVGSAYPIARHGGLFGQDLTSAPYRRMLEALEEALRQGRPLAWASGHEHGLQVLEGTSVRRILVSGAGILGHTKAPHRIPQTLFASGEAGFLRLDVASDGAVLLVALTVDREARVRERYSERLE